MKLVSIFQNVRIGPRLIGSFIMILALISIYTLANLIQVKFLEKQTEYLYEHPFLMSQTVREITADLMHVSLQVEMMAQETKNEKIIERSKKIESQIADMMIRVEALKQVYPASINDVEQFNNTIMEWKTIRSIFVKHLLNGENEQANALAHGKGKELYRSLQEQITVINKEAAEEAERFRKEAEKVYKNTITTTIIYGISLLTLIIIIAGLNIKSLLEPLKTLMSGTKEIQKGNYAHTVDVHSEDELGELTKTFNAMSLSIKQRDEELKKKNKENEKLLLSILPKPIAERLKSGEEHIADAFSNVAVLFADLVHFTEFSEEHSPEKVVEFLNELFTMFDFAANRHHVEKIKTIGDCYMAVCGLPKPNNTPTDTLLKTAIDMLEQVKLLNVKYQTNFQIRIGIHTGPVVAGIIGKDKFIYDLWGDTVNIASRMESHGVEGRIHLSEYAYHNLKEKIPIEERKQVPIKGKGLMKTYLVVT